MNRSKMLRKALSYDKLLLDQYSGALGAYSLRYLSSSFVGNNVVRVERLSDNTQQGFTPDEIKDGTLESFANNDFVIIKEWYDQSGDGNDVVQANNSRAPLIADTNGNLITLNSKPAVDFTSINRELYKKATPDLSGNIDASMFFVSQTNVLSTTSVYSRFDSYQLINRNNEIRIETGGGVPIASYPESNHNTNQTLLTGIVDVSGVDANLYLNGTLQDSSTGGSIGSSSDDIILGNFIDGGSAGLNGKIQEAIFYPSQVINGRSGVEENINNYYSIY